MTELYPGVLGIKGFLSPMECDLLRKLARYLPWQPGRQETGYEKAALVGDPLTVAYHADILIARALRTMGVPVAHAHDAYLLRYPSGSYIPPHKDDAPFGQRHRRLNAIVRAPEGGGHFEVEGKGLTFGLEGDAVMFYPSELVHAVTQCFGERLVFSVGVLV